MAGLDGQEGAVVKDAQKDGPNTGWPWAEVFVRLSSEGSGQPWKHLYPGRRHDLRCISKAQYFSEDHNRTAEGTSKVAQSASGRASTEPQAPGSQSRALAAFPSFTPARGCGTGNNQVEETPTSRMATLSVM